MEKNKISEVGLIMGNLNESNQKTITNNDLSTIAKSITTNGKFLDFYDAINKYNMGNGFYVKTALEIFTMEDNNEKLLASINDETKFKDDRNFTAS